MFGYVKPVVGEMLVREHEFYKATFQDDTSPLETLTVSVEGVVSYDALMFIPELVPNKYYTDDYTGGLQLYSSGVLIMDKCKELLPEYFNFVRGVVDSPDLSLNISREMLQHDRQLKVIAKSIEKKIKSELEKMMASDRAKYEKFFDAFGLQLKYGIYADFGMHKDVLKDLILFRSSEGKYVSLKEYTDAMKEEQTAIYYAAGETVERIEAACMLALRHHCTVVLKGAFSIFPYFDGDGFVGIKITRHKACFDFFSKLWLNC